MHNTNYIRIWKRKNHSREQQISQTIYTAFSPFFSDFLFLLSNIQMLTDINLCSELFHEHFIVLMLYTSCANKIMSKSGPRKTFKVVQNMIFRLWHLRNNTNTSQSILENISSPVMEYEVLWTARQTATWEELQRKLPSFKMQSNGKYNSFIMLLVPSP